MDRKHQKTLISDVVSIALQAGSAAIKVIGSAAYKTAFDWSMQIKKNNPSKMLSLTLETGSAQTLRLNNEVGNIEVKVSRDLEITVNVAIWILNNSSHEAVFREIVNQAEISIVFSGNRLEILTHPRDNSKLDLWEWAEKKYGYSKFIIDYIVELPATITNYEISTSVGEINLSDLKGNYRVHNNVGAITIKGAHIKGKSLVQTETGILHLGIHQMDDRSSIKAITEVGSTTAKLSESLQCSLKTKTNFGQISGAPKGNSNINGGGPLLSLASSVGFITIESTRN